MAYSYSQCDDYFAMADEYRESLRLHNARESEMLYQRQRQIHIADQLSRKDADDYADDILIYMHEQEIKCLPCVASIDVQSEIQWYMRPYLLDFLIEAHAAFGLLPETLFLATNILDRYCSKRVVYRKHYQLVGCTALLIASKYGECSKKVPHIKELASMCCSLYDEDMFIQMERHVMITLDWHVGGPTVDGFLQAALDEGMQDTEVEHMALYILEIALFHREFVSKRPSDLAKSALALARTILNRPQVQCHWSSMYDSETLVALSQHLHRPSQILLQKYRTSQTSRSSMVLEDFLTRHAAIARCAAGIAAPLTPPSDVPSPGPDVRLTPETLRTPQKNQYLVNMPNGCLTPPITPDIESFGACNKIIGGQRFPETPMAHRTYSQFPQPQATFYEQVIM